MSGIYRGPNGSATADALNIDGDKGNLTISNSGLEWTINSDAVDFSKIQNISTNTVLGRATAGTGDVEEITCTAAGRALLDDANAAAQRTTLGLGNAATGTIGTDVLAYDSNLQGFVNTFTLPTSDSTNGFVLTTNGTGTLSLTAPGGITDDDYGDITVSTGGTVWTIDNDAITTVKILDDNVTYAKIQNVSATDKLLGRSTAGAGDIEEITCTSAGRALLDDVDASAQRTTLGLGALSLQGDGDKGDITVSSSGGTWTIDNDVVTLAKLTAEAKTDKIQPITASVSSNALTITLNPTVLDFRSSSLTSGSVNTRAINSAISTVISSGSTGGTVNGVKSRLVVLAIDNAGTVVLGWTNLSGGLNLDETNLITTTAEGGAGGANSANVIYTTVAVTTPSPYRVVGYVESTQATAGTWATAPSTIQGYGGQALTAMSSLGYGQTWQNVTGSRTPGTTYYNTTGKPIEAVFAFYTANGGAYGVTVNGVLIARVAATSTQVEQMLTVTIPVNASYIYSVVPTVPPKIYELR